MKFDHGSGQDSPEPVTLQNYLVRFLHSGLGSTSWDDLKLLLLIFNNERGCLLVLIAVNLWF